jgi:uncharacterized protein (DUF433 family)
MKRFECGSARGTYFADEASGRAAKIGGTGLVVWEVLRDFSKDQDADRLRKTFPQLSRAQVTAALMYDTRYREEVQSKINANAALTPEAIEKQYIRGWCASLGEGLRLVLDASPAR